MPDTRPCFIAVGKLWKRNSISMGRFETETEAQIAFKPLFTDLYFVLSTSEDKILEMLNIQRLQLIVPEEPKATYDQLAQLLRDNGYRVEKILENNPDNYAKNIQGTA